jgi:hypothetical protein
MNNNNNNNNNNNFPQLMVLHTICLNTKGLSSKDFAILTLKHIHLTIDEFKNSLFPCNCNCISKNIDISFYLEGDVDVYFFKYSLEQGIYPFDLVQLIFSEFVGAEQIILEIKPERICG